MKKPITALKKTLILAAFMASGSGYVAYNIQATANKKVSGCSYLDPITIDIVAFLAGVFLIVESLVDIFKHKDSPVHSQFIRCLRLCFGTSIVVIHVMQFIHK